MASELSADAKRIKSSSWFVAVRSEEAMQLIRKNPFALVLAYIIAMRARYRDGFNADGLALGEAMLGDHENCGMTRQQHRTALAQLVKWEIATTRTTNRGTIARLIDTRLFEIISLESNHQNNRQPTIKQPTSNHQTTTNLEHLIAQNSERKTYPTKSGKALHAKQGPKKGLAPQQSLLAGRFETAFGGDWPNDAGKWVNRIKRDFKKAERVVAEVEEAIKGKRIKTTPPAYAEYIWKEFR